MPYIKGDGNGGVVVSKGLMAMISLILVIIGAIVPTVLGYGQLQQKVNTIQNIVDANQPKIEECQMKVAILEAKLDAIKQNTDDIKGQVNDVSKQLAEHEKLSQK